MSETYRTHGIGKNSENCKTFHIKRWMKAMTWEMWT